MAEEGPQGMHPSFARVIQQREQLKEKLSNIKHKIGVYSAKGGVGKTTVAVNLAYTLARMGNSVGLLDADIDCPNLPMFLGIEEKIDTSSRPFKPILKDGVKVASTAMLVDEASKPIIWRGPMITKMLNEMFEGMDWGALDYLIIDLSPGTSRQPPYDNAAPRAGRVCHSDDTPEDRGGELRQVGPHGEEAQRLPSRAWWRTCRRVRRARNTEELLKTLDTISLGTVQADA